MPGSPDVFLRELLLLADDLGEPEFTARSGRDKCHVPRRGWSRKGGYSFIGSAWVRASRNTPRFYALARRRKSRRRVDGSPSAANAPADPEQTRRDTIL